MSFFRNRGHFRETCAKEWRRAPCGGPSPPPAARAASGSKHYLPAEFSVVAMLVNFAFSALPRVPAPTMMASAMRAAIRPYSIAVAPDSFLTKRAKSLDIRELLLHVLQHFRQLFGRR